MGSASGCVPEVVGRCSPPAGSAAGSGSPPDPVRPRPCDVPGPGPGQAAPARRHLVASGAKRDGCATTGGLRHRTPGRLGGGAQPDPTAPSRRDPGRSRCAAPRRRGALRGQRHGDRAAVHHPSPGRPGSARRGTMSVARQSRGLVARMLALPIRAWRQLSRWLPPRCRFHPSCSEYAIQALELHGAAKGSWLAVRRIGRCHPWHDGGLDPVPQPNTRSHSAPPGCPMAEVS
jgi:putative membrane protein insertion efficiency factor